MRRLLTLLKGARGAGGGGPPPPAGNVLTFEGDPLTFEGETLTFDAAARTPTGVLADPGVKTVTLAWNRDPASSETHIYRGVAHDKLQLLATVASPTSTFTDTDLTPDLPYLYALSHDDGVTETPTTTTITVRPLEFRSAYTVRIETSDPTGASPGAATFSTYNAAGAFLASYADTGSVSGLKAAWDAHKANDAWIHLGPGTFIFSDIDDENHPTYNVLTYPKITGSGMSGPRMTLVKNTTNQAADTEPFSFTNCDHIVITDLAIEAGGAARSTSDALDIDDGDHCLIQRVWIRQSRARGLVLDGKDPGASARDNVLEDVVVSVAAATQGDGIELLGAERNAVRRVIAMGCGGHGIQLVKGSGASGAQSNHNVLEDYVSADNNGDGVNITSSSDNVTRRSEHLRNNANASGSNDGWKINTADNVNADRNALLDSRATDPGSPKTQDRGVQLSASGSATINATLLARNYLAGNLNGPLTDGGVGTVTDSNITTGSEATYPPPPPVGLTATIVGNDVVLTWFDSPVEDLASLTLYRGQTRTALAPVATPALVTPTPGDASTYLNTFTDVGGAALAAWYAIQAHDSDGNTHPVARASTTRARS